MATPRKLNCNPAKSHFCVGKTGRGSCIANTKACRVPLKGIETTIAAGTVGVRTPLVSTDIKIAGKNITVPKGVEIVAAKDTHIQSQIAGQPAYRIMPKGGTDTDYIRETMQGNYTPVLKFHTAEQAIKYAQQVNKALARQSKETTIANGTVGRGSNEDEALWEADMEATTRNP